MVDTGASHDFAEVQSGMVVVTVLSKMTPENRKDDTMPIRHLRELIFQELIALSLSTKRANHLTDGSGHVYALRPGCLRWYCVVVWR